MSIWRSFRHWWMSYNKELDPVSEEVDQLKFLLSQAPMIDMQADYLRRARTPYAYIHPDTLASVAHYSVARPSFCVKFHSSPTKWVPTLLMPKGRVIFSSVEIPYVTPSF